MDSKGGILLASRLLKFFLEKEKIENRNSKLSSVYKGMRDDLGKK